MSDILHAVSVSGGKDSTAMLILMLKHDMPIDVVFWADTGMEFPEMYRHINQLDTYLYRKRGIHITRLKERHTFEWMMFKKPITKKGAVENRLSKGLPLTGYGWPGKTVRWCTGYLKTHLIDRQLRQLSKGRTVIQYIGFAADEKNRCKDDPQFRYPLVELGVTEKQALAICYAHGFTIGNLYKIYNRASCWCCPLQSIDELRKLRRHHPELWAKLREMDIRAIKHFGRNALGIFKQNWPVEKLERRFAEEDRRNLKVKGEIYAQSKRFNRRRVFH